MVTSDTTGVSCNTRKNVNSSEILLDDVVMIISIISFIPIQLQSVVTQNRNPQVFI